MNNQKLNEGGTKSERSSNIELLRIIAMFFIIAHHSVVNSGIAEQFSFTGLNVNMIFLQLWGMWGKTAINAFVMITGFFMCRSRLTWKRFGKMYLQAKFYKILFFIIFAFAGYQIVSGKSILKLIFGNLYGINKSFVASFLAFYLFIPFYNFVIEKIGDNLWKLVLSLLILFTIISTFFMNDAIFHYVFWYMTLYFTAAWIRLYPNKWTESKKFSVILLVSSVVAACISVLGIDFIGYIFKWTRSWTISYYFVSDSNKLLAFLVGASAFLFFKNCNIIQSKVINRIATTTFGVLLIHANSDAMRQWLWKDMLHMPELYTLSLGELILAEVLIVLCIFIIASLLDSVRIYVLERPLFSFLDKHTNNIDNYFKNLGNFLFGKFHSLEIILERFLL